MRALAFVLAVVPTLLSAATKPCSVFMGLSSPAAKTLHRLNQPLHSAVVSPDGKRLTVGTRDGQVVTLDSQTLEVVHTAKRGDAPVGLAYQGNRLFGVTGKVLFEVVSEGAQTEVRQELPEESTAIAAAGDILAVTQPRGSVELRKNDGTLLHRFRYPRSSFLFSWLPRASHYVSGLALTEDGSRVAAAIDTSKQVKICVWETASGRMLYCVGAKHLAPSEGGHSGMDGASPRCNAIHFTRDGRALVTAWSAFHSTKGYWVEKAFLFDGLTGRPMGDMGHAHGASQTPSPGESRSLSTHSVPDYLAIGRAGSEGVGYTIAYRWLIHGFLPRVDIWDTSNGRRVATLIGHRDPVDFVLFSPNGNDFFSISRSGEVVRWSVAELLKANGNRLFVDDGTFLTTEWSPYAGRYDRYLVQDQ